MTGEPIVHDYEKATYGERIADIYDDWMHSAWEPRETVDAVAECAGGGAVLELGVGTGRIALPLARAGLKVTGVDVSPAMLAKLREKDPDGLVEAVEGDFTELPVDGAFSVVFVVNSLLQLSDPADQMRCLVKVRERLEPGGVFVMEEANPAAFTGGGLQVAHMTTDELHLIASEYDSVRQLYRAQHVILRNDRTRLNPVTLRLTSPAEFDLMAEKAGMRLRERWGNWARTIPYLAESRAHISFYEAV
ncbi:class I SAM-dependent methyltransferase [Planomonospora sp. ID67723]|uniref:class I SAM-dependent methyltransferase n=1 Tax=Planomonospora sp. ID67723 TaxID=2738134 RepID=UPI0018C3D1A6|nr:class I SAM-dependent methyltransferase [Planomonospora sp. ID67723]MBG0833218.1 class I SAM-dependent methyltransferase [Planomonospora sp. ID67723]